MNNRPLNGLTAIILLCWAALTFPSHGAPGDVDRSFDSGSGIDGSVSTIAVQPDGKVLIGSASFRTVSGLARPRLARLNIDGTGDPTFTPDSSISGIRDPNSPVIPEETSVNAVVLQPDGKALVAGSFNSSDGGANPPPLVRIHSDGSLDLSFAFGSGDANSLSGPVKALALQADGKIVVLGLFTLNGTGGIVAARLNSDGSVDDSFTPATGTSNNTTASLLVAAIQPDGKLLIGGFLTTINGIAREGVARLNANGTLDGTFIPASTAVTRRVVRSLGLQADGKVLFGGFSRLIADNSIEHVVRLNANGSTDSTFNGATESTGNVFSLALQPDGRMLIAGAVTTGVARLNTDGSLDTSFNPGIGTDLAPAQITLQSDGKVLFAGAFTSYDGAECLRVARVHANGSLDAGFRPSSGIHSEGDSYCSINAIAEQPDGRILVGGFFTAINGFAHTKTARLNADGTRDPGFNAGPANLNGQVWCVLVQPDGKVLIAGELSSGNIVRRNSDGTLDASFNPGTGPDAGVYALALQEDGKILIGGRFTQFNGFASSKLGRLNADGSFDTTFNSGTGTGGAGNVFCLAVQPDGRILRGGDFIARLNANGSLDPGFDPGTGVNGLVRGMILLTDGRLLIGGDFTAFNGASINHIARLNANGSLDISFDPGTGANDYVFSMGLQPNGKLLIGGKFTAVNEIVREGLARLNFDGSLDESFAAGSINGGVGTISGDLSGTGVNAIAMTANGRAFVAGNFTSINGVAAWRVARLELGGVTNLPPTASVSSPTNGATFTAPAAIPIAVDAFDGDGFVIQVDVYAGETLIGSDLSAPFQVTFSNVLPGNYAITAKATDNLGAVTTSGPVNISVTNVAPTVAITSPPSGSTYQAPATIAIHVDASDSDGSITRVDVLAGQTLLTSSTSPSLIVSWENVLSGSYSLTAIATDNLGATTTSPAVAITVTPPPMPPLPPSGLIAKAGSRTRIKLSWTDNAADETNYKIERAAKGQPFSEIGIVGAGVITFTDRGLRPGRKYTYKVRATNVTGDSAYSSPATAKTKR